MQHDQFIGEVQNKAGLDSRGAAERATRASLETLSERIPAGLADNIAAQLPHEIGEHMRRVATAPDVPYTGMRMTTQEFFDRVASRSGAKGPAAVYQARCVMEVVGEATQGGLMTKVREALPDELCNVLLAGSTGHVPNGGARQQAAR
ncbi:DUF2267 domain-containing protein [Streptomyces sp. YIM 98790]|uniref:DUF2267 domain-containing protein n=1 Tax=Streptomyces sp. YIM 98790 TaxID=2689077 RepID=UPI0014089CC8|nr:DUF2267 domain-containing protein [Streptomyces sp. YIM 98790]